MIYFFLAAIKLLIKVIIAITDVNIIIETRITAVLSASFKAPNKGLTSPPMANNVNTTAIWAIFLSWFLMPLLHSKSRTPIARGISAV